MKQPPHPICGVTFTLEIISDDLKRRRKSERFVVQSMSNGQTDTENGISNLENPKLEIFGLYHWRLDDEWSLLALIVCNHDMPFLGQL
ncbi:conserved hypothetical protein [Ricinus communis]|uniref:Uncharacterized protein n=1 Tax=Ricinus communis TaxID=3988 RepID=B9RPD6_RICCO|nr:conserved hypothetical protein [Ricinus communis]